MEPRIETARLILRRPAPRDYPAFAAYFMSDRARFTGGQPDPILAWNRFCVTLGHWPMRGYGVLTMEDRATCAAIGAAGPFFPMGWPEPEIAWQIWDGAAEGRGLATEAARAARDWSRAALGWTAPVSLIAPDNARSQAVARRLGCRREGIHPHPHFGPLDIWRHPAS